MNESRGRLYGGDPGGHSRLRSVTCELRGGLNWAELIYKRHPRAREQRNLFPRN